MEFLQIITFTLGGITTLLSCYLAYRFYRVNHALSTALAFMLGGEAIAGIVTLIFTGSSMFNAFTGTPLEHWNNLSPEVATALRWSLFLVVGVTSIHLYKTLQKIVN
jgi:ABC-type Mn2+/Zn2+ transport system permease subunit